MEVGVKAFKDGRYEDAVAAFEKALKNSPGDVTILDSKAAALQRMGRTKEALEAARMMIKNNEKSHRGYHRAIKILLVAERFARARAVMESALVNCGKSSSLRKLSVALNAAEAKSLERRENPPAFKLSSDLLELVVLSASQDDPGAAVRVSHVCSRWRAAIVASPRAWGTLKIDRIKNLAKVKTWLHRSNNRIESLLILRKPPNHMANDLALLLRPTMPDLRRLELHGVDTSLLGPWRGRCRSLQHLSLNGLVNVTRLDAALLSTDARGLLVISMSKSSCMSSSPSDLGFLPPARLLQRLYHISLNDIIDAPQVLLPPIFFQMAPSLRVMDFDNVAVRGTLREGLGDDADGEQSDTNAMPVLERLGYSRVTLSTISASNREVAFDFNSISATSLKSLRINRVADRPTTSGELSTTGLLGQTALTDSLPRLEILDLSACVELTTANLQATLSQLAELRFINISNTQVGIELFELLASSAEGERPLLPKLVAISAATCNLTGGPIVRLVKSRLGLTPAQARSSKEPERKRRRTGPFRPTIHVSEEHSEQRQSLTEQAGHKVHQASRIKWLCLDGNPNIEIEAVAWLRTTVPFLSCQWDSFNASRAAGLGRWQWDA